MQLERVGERAEMSVNGRRVQVGKLRPGEMGFFYEERSAGKQKYSGGGIHDARTTRGRV